MLCEPTTMQRRKVYSVALELTAYCNQKCAYCYNEWREDGGASVSAGEGQKLFARVEKLLEAFEIDHVTLTGGEPFAHKEIFRLLDRLRDAAVPIQIISNGGLVDDVLAKRLQPYKIRYVQCTLNAPNPELHAEHVGGDGHFEKTIEGVKALRRHGVPVVGCIVLTKKNAHLVGEILQIWKDLGVRQIALSRFSPAGFATKAIAELLPTRDEIVTAFEQALPFAKGGMSISCTMPIPPCAVETELFAPIRFGTCPIGTSMQELALGPDGKLKNCTLHRTAIGGVPDILDPNVDLRALLDAPEITQYRKQRPDFCAGCLHENTCAGGCGAAAEWVLGSRKEPDPFLWQHVDEEFGATLQKTAASASERLPKRRLDVLA
jgi:radical SAM protein with 4Fe4S-binding SPASM domain